MTSTRITDPAYIAVTADVQRLTPATPMAAISLQRGWDGQPERCYALRIGGPARVVYLPDQRLISTGNSMYLVAEAADVTPMSLEESAAMLAHLEARKSGQPRRPLVYVRANQNLTAANRTQGSRWPAIAVQGNRTGATAQYTQLVEVAGGPSYLLACPHRRLACGAKIYLVADQRETTLTPLDPITFKDIRGLMQAGTPPQVRHIQLDPSGTITVGDPPSQRRAA